MMHKTFTQSTFLRLVLIFVVSFGSIAMSVEPNSPKPFLFVLDLDRLFIKDKAVIVKENDPREYLHIGDETYRLAAFAPEFLVALRFYFPQKLNAPVRLSIFSGGSQQRNQAVVDTVKISDRLSLSQMVDEVKSFDDLKTLVELPDSVHKHDALDYINSLGGQDFVPFFSLFTKDLTVFANPLERTFIFEDNLNAVPLSQAAHLIAAARPDISEAMLSRHERASSAHSRKDGDRIPVQIARAKYRLVRAVGLLSVAIQAFQAGHFPSLSAAVDALQWDREGHFKEVEVNDVRIYLEGMRILKASYKSFILPYNPTLARATDYFEFKPLIPRAGECSTLLAKPPGVLPWEMGT